MLYELSFDSQACFRHQDNRAAMHACAPASRARTPMESVKGRSRAGQGLTYPEQYSTTKVAVRGCLQTISCSCDPRKSVALPCAPHRAIRDYSNPQSYVAVPCERVYVPRNEASLPSLGDESDASDHFTVGPGTRGPQPHTLGSGIWIDPTTIRHKKPLSHR